MDVRSVRNRGAAAIVASMTLVGSGLAASSSPAASAPPPPSPDCATPFPQADVTAGQPVEGLTVATGTEPTPFAGEVIGVLDNGIAPGVDMILADLANPTGDPGNDTPIDDVGGIWQGMSGSPVYAANGQLIGAVAYGLSFGPSTVAGITPYEEMDDYLTPSDPPAPMTRTLARAVARSTDVTAAQAGEGLARLRVPLSISGIAGDRLGKARAARRNDFLRSRGRADGLVGRAAAADAVPEDLVDGGNLGAAISYGTITAGGVGTVTDVCEEELVGFGHPMLFAGRTSMGMMPADALYVQPESLGPPFKVANMADPAGTITDDRLTGISGDLGVLPPETDINSSVRYGTRAEDGLSHVLDPDWSADVTLMQLLSLHDVTVDGVQGGTEVLGATITVDDDGAATALRLSDRYTSTSDISFESVWGIAELVYLVSQLEGVEVTGVTTDSEVTDDTASYRLGEVQQRRAGRWLDVNRRNPAVATPGGTMRLRVELVGPDGSSWLVQQVSIPRRTSRVAALSVTGGAWTYGESLYDAQTVQQVRRALAEDVRNDEVQTRVAFGGFGGRTVRERVSAPQDRVVEGSRSAPIVVRR